MNILEFRHYNVCTTSEGFGDIIPVNKDTNLVAKYTLNILFGITLITWTYFDTTKTTTTTTTTTKKQNKTTCNCAFPLKKKKIYVAVLWPKCKKNIFFLKSLRYLI